MASVSLPLHLRATAIHQHSSPTDSSFYGRSRRIPNMPAPLPNPPFVFPARDPDNNDTESSTMAGPDTKTTPPPLPAFSFNPGAAHASQPSMPALSPHPRNLGHRRQHSEFVGAERPVLPGVMGASQDNDEKSIPVPAKLPAPGPGFSAPYRRSHAHRRSAAVSSVDLSIISKSLETKPIAGSAPCTPADMKQDRGVYDEIARPMSYSATSLGRPTPPASPLLSSDRNSPFHAKPGFNDGGFTVRRPLSTISSETSGSVATVQPDNTTRNSGPVPNNQTTLNPQKSKPRPRTADASLTLDISEYSNAKDDSQTRRPLSASGRARAKKSISGFPESALRKSFVGDDAHSTDNSRRSSSDDGYSETSLDDHRDSSDSLPTPSSKNKSSKSKKRQKKVRSWAGAILKVKTKRHHSKKEPVAKSATPPPIITRTNSDLGSGLDVNFDDDAIVVIRSPTNPNAPVAPEPSALAVDTDVSSSLENAWKPRSFYEQSVQNDTLSPVIDLDAALGPFNTPDMGAAQVAGTGFSAARNRMYSGGRRGKFVGPEMRYHRRAESAPEMPPFDRSFLGGSRLAADSAMATEEVFYEEEEDAFLAAGNQSPPAVDEPISDHEVTMCSGDEADKQSVSSRASSDTLTRQPVESQKASQNTGLGIQQDSSSELPASTTDVSTKDEQQRTINQPGAADMVNPFANRPQDSIEIIKQDEWQPKALGPPSPDVSPRFLPVDKRPSTSPVNFACDIPHLSLQGGSPLPNSSFPSPDFIGASPDAPRSITTPSTSDRNFSNPSYITDMSPEYPHASVEDVPSLTSSASTMTNTMHRFSATFFSRPRLSSDRAASFSAAVNRRTSQSNTPKRSSLASLSKLVVGAHAEKSKLCYEEKPPSDEHEKAKKKGRRLSRLMHFWRTKDKEKSHDDAAHPPRPS